METTNVEKIYLAGGCFWGTDRFFKHMRGIEETHAGYVNSDIPNPTYKEVCTGKTGAAECAEVLYNATTVDLSKLLDLFFKTFDPTQVDGQGTDHGTQYRSGIFYTTDSQRNTAMECLHRLEKAYGRPLPVEVRPCKNFTRAEPEHQDYLERNPDGYCHIPPKVMELARHASILKSDARRRSEEADIDLPDSVDGPFNK